VSKKSGKKVFQFFGMVSLVLAAIYAFLVWRLTQDSNHPQIVSAFIATPFIAVLSHFTVMFLDWDEELDEKPILQFLQGALQWSAYLSMPILSFLLPLVLLRDVALIGITQIFPSQAELFVTYTSSKTLLIVSLSLVVLGACNAKRGLHVVKVTLPYDDLPIDLDGLTIAQISDLHIGSTISPAYVENVVKQVNHLKANIIVMTGDIGDGEPARHPESLKELGRLRTVKSPRAKKTSDTSSFQKLIYYVTGNHEYYWGSKKWIDALTNCGVIPLLNTGQTISFNQSSLGIAGVIDPAASQERKGGKPDPKRAYLDVRNADLKLLLAHQPGIAGKAESLGFDLQLSGHTHGGQFFPWTLVVRKVHRYHQGLFTLNKMKIYVNPGTGSWGPPIRLGTRPEITHFTLKRS
jgi:predicted MPP superfamily phosphohydrolase